MTNERSQDAGADTEVQNEQAVRIDRALEDAERMLYFASKGKIDNQTDLICLRELAKVVVRIRNVRDRRTIDEDLLAAFYSQLSIMSHILYPVTSESLKVMDELSGFLGGKNGNGLSGVKIKSIWPGVRTTWGLITLMSAVAIISLVITPWIFTYSLEGSNIVSRLDATMKERVAIKKEMVAEVNRYSPEFKRKTDNQGATAGNRQTSSVASDDAEPTAWRTDDSRQNASDGKQLAMVISHYEVKTAMVRNLIAQLGEWNTTMPGPLLGGKNPVVERSGAPPDEENIVCKDAESCLKKAATYIFGKVDGHKGLDSGLSIKNRGILILQTVNGTILPLLFGFCGAAAFILKITLQAIQNHTFKGIHCTTWIRLLLGTFCGFFLGYLGGNDELRQMLTFENQVQETTPITISQFSALTLAFIGGYSVDLLFSILNRFIYAITNDDRYLPASEIIRRKVDVEKFIHATQQRHPTRMRNEAGQGDIPADRHLQERQENERQGNGG